MSLLDAFTLRPGDPVIFKMSLEPPVEAVTECKVLPGYEKGLVGDMRRALKRKNAALLFAYVGMDTAAAPYQSDGFAGWAFSGYIFAPMHTVKNAGKQRDIDGDAFQGKRISQIANMIAHPAMEKKCGVMDNMLQTLQQQHRRYGYDVLRMTIDDRDKAGMCLLERHAFQRRTVRNNLVSMVYIPDEEVQSDE